MDSAAASFSISTRLMSREPLPMSDDVGAVDLRPSGVLLPGQFESFPARRPRSVLGCREESSSYSARHGNRAQTMSGIGDA